MFLNLAEVIKQTTLSKPTIYNKIKQGTFPKQYKLGERKSAWLKADIDAWIASITKQEV